VANLIKFVQMEYKQLNIDDISFLKKVIGVNFVFTDEEKLAEYSHDETEDLFYPPEVVLKPKTSDEIADVLKYCNAENIPVTPCGGRTGLSGGSLPIYGGVALSTERLNAIIEIDERNLQATVEPGVINQFFRNAVSKKGLFYRPDPSS